MAHPNIQLLERAAESLGELLDQFVFVGRSTTVLMISDPAAPPSQVSKASRNSSTALMPSPMAGSDQPAGIESPARFIGHWIASALR